MKTDKKPPTIIECCQKCVNRNIDQAFCYNGQQCFQCPSYQQKDCPKPPNNIKQICFAKHS